jgi:hypothetical protein
MLFVNPNSTNNKVMFISSDAFYDTKAYVRVDNGKIHESDIIVQNKYNFIKFQFSAIKEIYDSMRIGEQFFIRFTIKDKMSATGFREITSKISLGDFQKAFTFFLNQRNKYDKYDNVNNKK